jgi:hypothetical protein
MRKLATICLAAAFMAMGFSAHAQTTIGVPFPPKVKVPGVPAYTEDPSAWPISLIFLPPVLLLNVLGRAGDLPNSGKHLRSLTVTTVVMAKHGIGGYRKFKAEHPRKKPKKAQVAKASCTYVGNWVGAPCQ